MVIILLVSKNVYFVKMQKYPQFNITVISHILKYYNTETDY